ncbi:MAG: YihY/virulence factor BrkB family protein [Clostridiaceae bacterium]|jgi:membrane protein|nr:YihY/virulence factor BrkB family protein [Clostridiaceae bacterium]
MNEAEEKNTNPQENDPNEKLNRPFTTQINDLQRKLSDYAEDKSWVQVWKERLQGFFSLKVGINSAASAFYLIFSIFPLILFVFSLLEVLDAGMAARFEAAIPQVSVIIPEAVVEVLHDFLNSVQRSSSVSVLSVTALALLWAASRGVGSVVASLNKIYHRESPNNFLLRRLFGIMAIFASSVLLLVILVLLAFNRLVRDYLQEFISLPEFILQSNFDLFANLAAFLVLTFIFTVIFSVLKRQRSYFRHTLSAAALTSVGWIAISYGLSYFISTQSKYYLMYGSITGIIFLMLWLYLAVYIMMIGAFIHAELILKFPRPGKDKNNKKKT